MKHLKHLILVCLAVSTFVTVFTACNGDDNSIDYTQYYGWRDQNNQLSATIEKQYKEDPTTYFNHRVESLQEPGHYSYWHLWRTNSEATDRVHPYANSKLKLHYTLYKTQSVMNHLPADVNKWNDEALMNSIFFDSSNKADTLQSMQVQFFENCVPNSGVIKGWCDILQQMYVGDIFVVYIPWFLAYGQTGKLPDIDPYSSLFFRIELCEITHLGGPTPKQE